MLASVQTVLFAMPPPQLAASSVEEIMLRRKATAALSAFSARDNETEAAAGAGAHLGFCAPAASAVGAGAQGAATTAAL